MVKHSLAYPSGICDEERYIYRQRGEYNDSFLVCRFVGSTVYGVKIAPNRLAAGRLCNMAIDETTDTKYINFIKYSCCNVPPFRLCFAAL